MQQNVRKGGEELIPSTERVSISNQKINPEPGCHKPSVKDLVRTFAERRKVVIRLTARIMYRIAANIENHN